MRRQNFRICYHCHWWLCPNSSVRYLDQQQLFLYSLSVMHQKFFLELHKNCSFFSNLHSLLVHSSSVLLNLISGPWFEYGRGVHSLIDTNIFILGIIACMTTMGIIYHVISSAKHFSTIGLNNDLLFQFVIRIIKLFRFHFHLYRWFDCKQKRPFHTSCAKLYSNCFIFPQKLYYSIRDT